MKTLTSEQMDVVQETAPVAMKTQKTPGGIVNFAVTCVGDCYALASVPFEVIGAYEGYPSLGAAIARMMSCADAVAHDGFPPPVYQDGVAA